MYGATTGESARRSPGYRRLSDCDGSARGGYRVSEPGDVVTAGSSGPDVADSSTDGTSTSRVGCHPAQGRCTHHAVIQGSGQVWCGRSRSAVGVGRSVLRSCSAATSCRLPADDADGAAAMVEPAVGRPPTTGRQNPTSGSWPMWLSSIVGRQWSASVRACHDQSFHRSSNC